MSAETPGKSVQVLSSVAANGCAGKGGRVAVQGGTICIGVQHIRTGERQVRIGECELADGNGGMDVRGGNAIYARHSRAV